MRVEIIRERINVNIDLLKTAGDQAMREFYRLAMNMRDSEINRFEKLAVQQDLVFARGVEVLSHTKKTALISIFLDIEDDAKAIYFKLSIEPFIRPDS